MEEEPWIRALQERNNVEHSYNQEIPRGIVKRAKEGFYPLFCGLKKEIDEKWL